MTGKGKTWSEKWKRECLARWVAKLPTEQRKAFFQRWEKRHGRASAAALHRDAKREHERMKG